MIRNVLIHMVAALMLVGGCAAYAAAQASQPPVELIVDGGGRVLGAPGH
jgi:hypothetical protein